MMARILTEFALVWGFVTAEVAARLSTDKLGFQRVFLAGGAFEVRPIWRRFPFPT